MSNKEGEESKKSPETNDESSQESEETSQSEKSEEEIQNNKKMNLQFEDIQEGEREKLRGDAIGDTMYSERFVLKTLMELKEMDVENKLEEEMEGKLESLWDMTIEKAVIKLLLEFGVIDLFTNMIDETDDERLTEILLGIIGNMACNSETRKELCMNPIAMSSILSQLENSDPPILQQLMRLLHSAIIFENLGDELVWFKHFQNYDGFVEKFSYILSNSTSNTLLMSSFEAMNAICAKFSVIECQKGSEKDLSFPQLFVKKCLVDGLIEAFKQVIPLSVEATSEGSTDLIPTHNQQKFMNLFLELHNTISQYPNSLEAYEEAMPEFHRCIARVLLPLTQKLYLLPLSSTHQGIIEHCNDIIQALNDPFHADSFCNMVIIWDLIEEDKNKDKSNSDWEDEDDSNIVDSDDLSMSVLEFITRTANSSTQDTFTSAMKALNVNLALKLFERISDNDEPEDEIKSVIEKMKKSIKFIWDVEM